MNEESLQQGTIKHSTKIKYLFPLKSKYHNTGINTLGLFLVILGWLLKKKKTETEKKNGDTDMSEWQSY